jgi:DNA helicase-2/ATP-dependent DNA helicase PcrA
MTDIALDEATLWQVERDGHDITDSVAFHGPPGTGKTTTAAATVGRLIRDHGYDVSDVCWVTYRRSLARDTLQRLEQWDLLDEEQLNDPSNGSTRYIATAHAVGNRCGDIADEPVSAWQRANWCERRDMQYWTSEPWEDSAGKLLFRVFDYLANQHKTPEDREAMHGCPHYSDLMDEWRGDPVSAWYEWQDFKAQENLIDFHEMLSRPLENGKTPGRPILVIDEYHDVTGLMDELFRSWMEDAEIVLVAGDPHQVVNGFDGASPHYFESLDLPTVLLPKSWRCPQEHWQVATSMLANAHDVPDVTVDGTGLVQDYNSPRFEYSSDNGWVSLPGTDQPASPGKLAKRDGSTLFLARTQMQADGVGAALERAGIPYRSQADLNGWNTDNGGTRLRLFNALKTVEGYSPAAVGYSGSVGFDAYQNDNRDPRHAEITNMAAADLLDAVHASVLDMTRSEAEDVADTIRGDEGTVTLNEVDNWMTREFWEQYTAGSGSVDRLNKSVFGSEADRERKALRAALARLDEPVDVNEIETWAITIHASKGMEADDVVVYDGISTRIQQSMREEPDTRRNEYRTWYVALSRAKKRLHIMRNAFEWTNPIIPRKLEP